MGVVLTAAVHRAATELAGGLDTGVDIFTGVEERAACSDTLGEVETAGIGELDIFAREVTSRSVGGDEAGLICAERGCVEAEETGMNAFDDFSFTSGDFGGSFASPGRATGFATRWSNGTEDACRFLSSYS